MCLPALFFLKVIFAPLGPLNFHVNFNHMSISMSDFAKMLAGFLIGITLTLWNNLGSIAILTISNLSCFPIFRSLYLQVAKRIDFKSSHHKKKICNYVRWWILTKIMVIILQHIHVLTYYVVYLKLTPCYISVKFQ